MGFDGKESSIFEMGEGKQKGASKRLKRADQRQLDPTGRVLGTLESGKENEFVSLAKQPVLGPDLKDGTSGKEKARAGEGEPQIKEPSIDDQLIGKMGSTGNRYSLLEELLPQIDFNQVPISQPKRVLAKISPKAKADSSVEADFGENSEGIASRTAKRKKKPASLLDAYFKGL